MSPFPLVAILATAPPATLDLPRMAKLLGLSEHQSARSSESCTSRFILLGTLESTVPGGSLASIEQVDNHAIRTIELGSHLGDEPVARVGHGEVCLENGCCLNLFETPPLAKSPAPTGLRAESADTFSVTPRFVNDALAHLETLLMQARLVPAFQGNHIAGFRITNIAPGSLYEQLGLRNGDVLRRINGYLLDSPERALELYAQLRDARRLSVELDRGGAPRRITLLIE